MPIVKTFSPAGWDLDRPVAMPLRWSGRGLVGHDRREFLKSASHLFLPRMDSVKFAADEFPVHVVALGALETWGPNRNGDGFPKAACEKYHSTFEKLARYFNHHHNKPERGDPHYGTVKLAVFDPEMQRIELLLALNAEKSAQDRNGGLIDKEALDLLQSGRDIAVSMACALGGTLVRLDRGWKPVEEIVPGDRVLTHRGRYRSVHASMRRMRRQFVRISSRYCGRQDLEFTPDHEFYVARWRDLPRSAHHRNRRTSADPTGVSKAFRTRRRGELAAHARWLPCGELQPGDLLLMPIDRGDGSSNLSVRDARRMGYYMAEGSVTSDGYLCYTCHRADALPAEADDLFDSSWSAVPHSASELAVNLTVYDKPAASAVAGAVGRGVRTKTIPREVLDASYDVRLEFVAAWLNGDGWQDEKGLHWSTCSRTLSIELQLLLAALDIPASVYRVDHTSDLPHGVPRKGIGTEYTVNISNRFSGLFVGRSKVELREVHSLKTTVFVSGDHLAVPVSAVEFVERDVEVFDISVEEDESFTAFGFAVHNCRVPYDRCSWCGNKARTRDEYCTREKCAAGGCRDNLARLVKVAGDVHHVHVVNDEPAFFDISRVRRPADRTAYGAVADWAKTAGDLFDKVAAEACGGVPVGVLLAPPTEQTEDALRRHGMLKLAWTLVLVDRRECRPEFVDAALRPESMPAFDVSLLSPPGEKRAAADVEALADVGIVLTLDDFARWTGRGTLSKAAAARLPGLEQRMFEDDTIEAVLDGWPAGDDRPRPGVKAAAAACAADRSLFGAAVERRLRAASLRGLGESAFVARTAAPAAAEKLARDYAAYRVSALYRIAATCGTEFPLTARLALRQNRIG